MVKRTSRWATLALVVEQECREAAERALALATATLAAALKCWEAAKHTSALAILMLANMLKRQQAADRAQMSANIVSPNESIQTEFALCAAPLDAILDFG